MSKKSINRFLLTLCFFALCTEFASAQFTLVPIPIEGQTQKKIKSGRTKELAPMALPFWDDFSFSNSKIYPHDTLWQYGQSVWVNKGVGLNPPSQGVATFDGVDSLRRPYDVNDVLAKGIADRLISRPLILDVIPPAQRTGVYLSFYYQFRGNGEPPDPGDELRVLFKNATGNWIQVWSLDSDGTFDPTVFTQVLIPILDESYYHGEFQFRIENFARLSGPYDTWNIDYVYLNKGRSPTDTSYPDRTINLALTSMFDRYYAIPIKHFLQDPNSNLKAPILATHNMEFIPGNPDQSDVQPINYDSQDSVLINRGGIENIFTHTLDQATSIGNSLQPLEFRNTPIQTLPVVSGIIPGDSSAIIKLKLWINSGDNVTPSMSDPLGDYDPIKYAPIDFRNNDTTSIEYTLSNYYAYDDGSAEFGAALNQPGARLAYLFEMRTEQPDTLVALDLFFPAFGENLSQTIEVQILSDLSGDPGSFLHKQVTAVTRSGPGEFWRLVLNRFVGVQNEFYVGWKQSSTSVLAVGLDKSSDSSDKIFFNINGQWEQPTTLTGNLLIRPIFGKGDGIITGLVEQQYSDVNIYPNPSRGNFRITGNPEQVQLFDLMGREIHTLVSKETDQTLVTIQNPTPGIYILRLRASGRIFSQRIMVE
ncbi:MAG: T9SS type A sorting domain-containing protein [Cyclobacteriaceae bacterium]